MCGYVRKGQQGEIERIHPPPTNSKNKLKSYCEVGYANFRPNFFAAGKRISMDMRAWCPVALKRFVAFSKNGNVQENIYRLCNIKRLEQDIKSRCNPNFIWNAWKLKCSTVRVICTCDQCDLSILCTPTDSSDKSQLVCSTILLCLYTSKYDIDGSRLNYSTVSSNKVKYINM